MSVQFLVNSSMDQAALELNEFDRHFFTATLRSEGVSAMANVGTFMSDGLADLFAFFSNNWRGWEGSKIWRSSEGGLSIDAHSDRLGHIYLIVRLRDGAPAKWTLEAGLVLEPGMLAELAANALRFEAAVSVAQPHR